VLAVFEQLEMTLLLKALVSNQDDLVVLRKANEDATAPKNPSETCGKGRGGF